MFQHPAHIPVSFALAVQAVTHNQATERDWAKIDLVSRTTAMTWIEAIFDANGTPFGLDERQWWLQQFANLDN